MSDRLATWWRARSLREQRLLLAMFALLGVTAAWLGIVRPLGDALAEARGRHGRAVIALAEAKNRAEAIIRLERRAPPALPAPLEVVLAQSAAEAGFNTVRLDPAGPGRVTAGIDAARPQAAFAWIAAMVDGHGLVVESLAARPNADETLRLQVTFRARGR